MDSAGSGVGSRLVKRFATIDIGTNSVLLLVAQKRADGQFDAVSERAEITRLGQGVDATKRLSDEAMDRTLSTLESFTKEARELGADEIAVSATSAARDATNGAEFTETIRSRFGLEVEIIDGDVEAKLSFASAFSDFGGAEPLTVIDIGGGSTEIIVGDVSGAISFRTSFDVGSVRLTERLIKHDPPSTQELAALRAHLDSAFSGLARAAPGARLVGLAGTVTTLYAVVNKISPYDANLVHGSVLTLDRLDNVVERLAALPVHLRRTIPGLQPQRADVIVAGGIILQCALRSLGMDRLTVSDRGLRWGLLATRFGTTR
jgi:exopolyphosphatase/guanosine-5'-triphosphate,3'-diphosphate pyrophosphatase